MSDCRERIEDFSVPSNSSKCKLCSHFEKSDFECENGVIAFGASKRVRSFICANRVLTYESSRESRDSKRRSSQ